MKWFLVPVNDQGQILSYREIEYDDYETAALDLADFVGEKMLLTEDAFRELGGKPYPPETDDEWRERWQTFQKQCAGYKPDEDVEDAYPLPQMRLEDAHQLQLLEFGIPVGIYQQAWFNQDPPDLMRIEVIGFRATPEPRYELRLEKGFSATVGPDHRVSIMVGNKQPFLLRLLHALWMRQHSDFDDLWHNHNSLRELLESVMRGG